MKELHSNRIKSQLQSLVHALCALLLVANCRPSECVVGATVVTTPTTCGSRDHIGKVSSADGSMERRNTALSPRRAPLQRLHESSCEELDTQRELRMLAVADMIPACDTPSSLVAFCGSRMFTRAISIARPAEQKAPAGAQSSEDPDFAILRKLDPSLETAGVKALSDITQLDLSSVAINDDDMLAVSKANNVERLMLTATPITRVGLRRISTLKSLKGLNLGETHVTDEWLFGIPILKNIQFLFLDGTDVGERGLSWLTSCKNLRMLVLSRTHIRDADLMNLAGCKELDSLLVDDADLTGPFLKHCVKLPNLISISASGNRRLSESNFVHAPLPVGLMVLALSGTGVGDDCAKFVSSQSQLQSLLLRGTRITDRAMNEIAKVRTLELIDLADTTVSDKGINLLLKVENLKHLHLSGTLVRPECIANLKKRFKELDCVYLYPPKSPEALFSPARALPHYDNSLLGVRHLSGLGIQPGFFEGVFNNFRSTLRPGRHAWSPTQIYHVSAPAPHCSSCDIGRRVLN